MLKHECFITSLDLYLDTLKPDKKIDIFKCQILLTENFNVLVQHVQITLIVVNHINEDPIDKSALVLVLAWCQLGNKPLPGPMLTKYI